MFDSGASALITFGVYIFAVMLLAWLSHRLLRSRTFLAEYFLGSRSLGVWAFALTFAATSSSGGSFIGFPSLVYTHGWVVALWIGSYMIVPIVSMGLLAKRINQFGRITGAITIPDVMRDRFQSPAFGMISIVLIVFFMTFNLIAQFKGGSIILRSLLDGMEWFESVKHATANVVHPIPLLSAAADDPGYLVCLVFFSVAVVVYTAYGGFRAVVWTDVMQGFVMVGGVVLMLPLALYAVGGLDKATQEMAKMTPPRRVDLRLEVASPAAEALPIPHNTWIIAEGPDGRRVFRTTKRVDIARGETVAAGRAESGKDDSLVPAIELTYEKHVNEAREDAVAKDLRVTVVESRGYDFGAGRAGVYTAGPGPSPDSADGFLPLSLAISFFFMWTFSGAGQPSNMIRLMAFNRAGTLRKAIFTVSIYYSLIYFPLVIIFCCARVLLPGWETESDRIMPEMARELTSRVGAPWLAGLLVAAPFAAVMSTMDSFLLMISSAVVRDIYQRNIHPKASEKTIKRLTYAVTVAVGAAAMLAAINPPAFLQDVIVFTGSGLSTSFLAPVFFSLYWPRFNKQGAIAGMLGGFVTHITLYGAGYVLYGKMTAFEPLHFHPFLVGAAASFAIAVLVTLATPAPPRALVRKFFYKPAGGG